MHYGNTPAAAKQEHMKMPIDNAVLHAFTSDVITASKGFEETEAAGALRNAAAAARDAEASKPSFAKQLILGILTLGIFTVISKLTADHGAQEDLEKTGRQIADTLTDIHRELNLFEALADNPEALQEGISREVMIGREMVTLEQRAGGPLVAFFGSSEEGVVIENPRRVMEQIEDLVTQDTEGLRRHFDPDFVNSVLQESDRAADGAGNPLQIDLPQENGLQA